MLLCFMLVNTLGYICYNLVNELHRPSMKIQKSEMSKIRIIDSIWNDGNCFRQSSVVLIL